MKCNIYVLVYFSSDSFSWISWNLKTAICIHALKTSLCKHHKHSHTGSDWNLFVLGWPWWLFFASYLLYRINEVQQFFRITWFDTGKMYLLSRCLYLSVLCFARMIRLCSPSVVDWGYCSSMGVLLLQIVDDSSDKKNELMFKFLICNFVLQINIPSIECIIFTRDSFKDHNFFWYDWLWPCLNSKSRSLETTPVLMR